MLEALETDADFVGYWDADLATPLDAVPRFLAVFEDRPGVNLVLGSRVKLLGRTIDRHAWRHYLGRVFATLVSEMLHLAVYDTQCGAKLFRSTDALRRVLTRPFTTSYQDVSFDTSSNPRHGPVPHPVNGRRGWNGCASTSAPWPDPTSTPG